MSACEYFIPILAFGLWGGIFMLAFCANLRGSGMCVVKPEHRSNATQTEPELFAIVVHPAGCGTAIPARSHEAISTGPGRSDLLSDASAGVA